jgi:hypothetical protein
MSDDATTDGSAQINLLKWNVAPEDPPAPTEHYARLYHFGDWIVMPKDPHDCIDTRNKVLIRDSDKPVEMRSQNRCKVETGDWLDPYTTKNFTNSLDIQIDHVVPLKNAYNNGAWRWTYQARCLYANFLAYHDHLLPVSGVENMTKGAGSPADYMPPNPDYHCAYVKNWLTIKLIWRLGMQRSEAQAIKDIVDKEKCDPSTFTFSTVELARIRATMQSGLALCPQTPAPNIPKPTNTDGDH